MTLSELQKWRKSVPFFIFSICLLPWFVVRSRSLADADLQTKIIVPAVALVAAFFYVTLDLRRSRWTREIDGHVGKQIQDSLLNMIPIDLAVTETEKNKLAESEVLKTLTGVFWETVDQSEALTSYKEHFYSNGIEYSTVLDVFLICGFAGFCYAVVSLAFADSHQAYIAAFFIAVALICRLLAIPRARQRHIQLAKEQLARLSREEAEFVSKRFRETILQWRRKIVFP